VNDQLISQFVIVYNLNFGGFASCEFTYEEKNEILQLRNKLKRPIGT